jgi:hypothetical protein
MPSDTNAPTGESPEDFPPFFVDECLSQRWVAEALRNLGAVVFTMRDVFPAGTIVTDEEWLRLVGKNGWVALTKDKHIRHRQSERRALRSAKVRAFVLVARKAVSGADQGLIFGKALKRMRAIIATTAAPFIASVDRVGHVELLDLPED